VQRKFTVIIYWIATGFLTVIILFSAGLYIFNHETAMRIYVDLGYPTYIIYPSAIAKLLGLSAILILKNKTLKEWAYSGFFFVTSLALSAHLVAGDGEHALALIAFVSVIVSYTASKKLDLF